MERREEKEWNGISDFSASRCPISRKWQKSENNELYLSWYTKLVHTQQNIIKYKTSKL